jgi:hypothetical protein
VAVTSLLCVSWNKYISNILNPCCAFGTCYTIVAASRPADRRPPADHIIYLHYTAPSRGPILLPSWESGQSMHTAFYIATTHVTSPVGKLPGMCDRLGRCEMETEGLSITTELTSFRTPWLPDHLMQSHNWEYKFQFIYMTPIKRTPLTVNYIKIHIRVPSQ